MYIITFGFRGFPGIEGGIETHAQHLYPLLVELGCKVDVLVRSRYLSKSKNVYQGVNLIPLWSPRGKGIETFCHSFFCLIYSAVNRPDILHIHGIGPSLMTPLARILGLRVVVTHHGQDYDATKWGIIARIVLRIGEWIGMRFAHQRIVVSKALRDSIINKYKIVSTVIYNGVDIPDYTQTDSVLNELELCKGKYIIEVGRITPHKKQIDLINAFAMADLSNWKLVIVGRTSSRDKYSNAVNSLAEKTPNVIVAGFRHGLALEELYAHAGAFVMPSSYEGMPIAVLEALCYGLPVILSNIPAHLEIGLPGKYYYQVGNVDMLTQKLKEITNIVQDNEYRIKIIANLREQYNWERIAKLTFTTYQRIFSLVI